MNEIYEINNKKYKLIKEYKEGFDKETVESLLTDYFFDFDYVFGDWAYSKLRLKGFYKHDNKLRKDYNDYNKVDDYINNNCAYGCKYFILEKLVEKQK